MAKADPIKLGFGAGSIFLGIYLIFNQENLISVIIGIGAIAFGIGLIASNQ